MLEKRSEELYEQLEAEIKRIIAKETDPFNILSAILQAVREALHQLKTALRENPFTDELEQIRFFKHIKPRFQCLRIFYLDLHPLPESWTITSTTNVRRSAFR